MNTKSKEFTVSIEDKEFCLYFDRPNVSQLFDIDLEYRKCYADAIRAGAMTEVEARKAFSKSESWCKSDDEKIQKIATQIALMSQDLENPDFAKNNENMKKIKKIAELRVELIRLNNDKIALFDNTAESLANVQKIHKLAELCCVNKDSGEKFFDCREHYERFSICKKEALAEIFKHAIYFEYGADEDITKNWVEMTYLTQYAEHLKKEDAKEKASKEEVVK